MRTLDCATIKAWSSTLSGFLHTQVAVQTMGNLCDCLEQQPPPEEKKKMKEHKTRLSAQQLLESTETGTKKETNKEEPGVQDDGNEGDREKKAEEPTEVEANVETHEDPPAGDEAASEGEVEKPKEKTAVEDKQPLLEGEEEPATTAVEVDQQKTAESQADEEKDEDDDVDGDSSDDEEEDSVVVAGGSRLMRSFVHECQIRLTSQSSCRALRIMEDGTVNGLGGTGKRATFTIHVKGRRRVALQNVKDPEKWLQVKDDELSGNGTGDEHCHFNLSEHGGCVVLEPVLAPGTHIGVRENGDIKKPSHTGTRNHAHFIPTMTNTTLAGESALLAVFQTSRRVYLTSRASGKSLRIVEKEVNGLGGKGKKASFHVHVRGDNVVALQNVKDPQSWLRIRNSKLEGNGKGGRLCEFKVEENDGHVTLESVAAPGNYVGIDSEGSATVPSETDPSSETAHFSPNVKLQNAGDSELLSMFTDENVIVLESRASGKTLRFREGEIEGTGGHGSLAQFIVHVKGPGIVALQNKHKPRKWLRIVNDELNQKGSGGTLCHWKVEEVEGYVVLESVRYPGSHVGVRENGDVKKPSDTGKGKHAQFTPIVRGTEDTEDTD